MNPYLEHANIWHDLHGVMVTLMRLEIAEQVSDRYDVSMDENVYVQELDSVSSQPLGRLDVHVAAQIPAAPISAAGTLLVEAPVLLELPIESELLHERYLEVRDRLGNRLVTVIELLSPTNKTPGQNRDQYLRKRRQYLATDVNLVEIDLLRGGMRVPVRNLPDCDYCVVVSPGPERPRAGVWPIRLRERLPSIPIPLLPDDPPARLELQQILDTAYDRGRFDRKAYHAPPNPPLSPEDDAWARELLRAASIVPAHST